MKIIGTIFTCSVLTFKCLSMRFWPKIAVEVVHFQFASTAEVQKCLHNIYKYL